MAQRIEHGDAPEDIFQAMAESAVTLSGSGVMAQDLSNMDDLANVSVGPLRFQQKSFNLVSIHYVLHFPVCVS